MAFRVVLVIPGARPGALVDKFLFLENFDRLPEAVRMNIIKEVLTAPENHHTEVIKEELAWIVNNEKGGSFKYH